MHHYNVRREKLIDTRYRSCCIVCYRHPRKNRWIYHITSHTDEMIKGAQAFHHGSTDTRRCTMLYILENMSE